MTRPLYRDTFKALYDAYVEMANEANYRPAAPSDGFGHVTLTDEQTNDVERFRKEAEAYAERFRKEEDSGTFLIGKASHRHLRALVYTVEAGRAICGGKEDLALTLLRMA